jgi:hypothetical protein
VGNSNSYFATQVRQLMDQGANDADIQAVIDAMNGDVTRGMQGDLWALDAQAQGTGRFGGDMWSGLANQARSGAAREMATNASSTRLNELAQRRAMQQGLLGQVNTRDLGAMQDATQRYGIDASASAAGAGAGDAAAATRRAQDLQALGMLMNNQQFGTNQLAGLGGQLSSDQLNAIGAAPSLAGIGLSGLGQAGNSAQTLAGMDAARLQAQTSRGIANSQLNQQAQMWNAGQGQQQIQDYLQLLQGIGGMGGYSNTQGQNVVPGLGVNPNAAALMGGYAGYYGGGR